MSGLQRYYDKAVAIYGAGPAGLSAFSALYKAGAHVFIWDQSEEKRQQLESAQIKCTDPSSWPWEELEFLLPDITAKASLSLSHPVLKKAKLHDVVIYSDVDLFTEALSGTENRPFIVGITGTYGKSTTASMLVHVLNSAGKKTRIVEPLHKSAFKTERDQQEQVYILELPARQLVFTNRLRCDVAILLNQTAADINFFGSAENAIKAASRIFRNQAEKDALIIGADDTICQKLCTAVSSGTASAMFGSHDIIPISGEATLGQGIFALDGHVFDARQDKSITIGDVSRSSFIAGRHFNQNMAAVYAASMHLGLSPAQVTKALLTWQGYARCMHYEGDIDGIAMVDDSKSVTLTSTLSTLTANKGVFWVGGGRLARKDFKRLKEARGFIEKAFFFGEAARKMEDASQLFFQAELHKSAQQALAKAIADAKTYKAENPGIQIRIVVSPGCPGIPPGKLSALIKEQLRNKLEGTAA